MQNKIFKACLSVAKAVVAAAGVVVVAVGVLWAAMLAHHCPRRSRSAALACVANLKQIDGAISTWALEQKVPNGTAVDTSGIFGPDKYIRAKPMCPKGGDYLYLRVGDPAQVKCPNAATLTTHVLPTSQ